MKDLKGKVAVVTGAASGIGYALSQRFAEHDMCVAMADIEETALDAAVQQVGSNAIGVVVDVREAEQVNDLAHRAVREFGAVHVVCNNAGVGLLGLAHETPVEDWEWVLAVNLWGVINGIRAFLPLLLDQNEGHIVNTASTSGLAGEPFQAAYGASKAAIVSVTEAVVAELAMVNSEVGASVLCPGAVRTRILDEDRNRFWGRQNDGPAGEAIKALTQMGQAAIEENGMDPLRVADHVIDAIRTKNVHILTHAEYTPVLRQRMQSLLGVE